MATKKSIKENKKSINEDGYFKVSLDTFLYNAGIVGFIEVLEKADAEEGKDKDFYIKGQDLLIKKEFLKSPNLAQAYIDSICDKFKNDTFFEKIKNEKSSKKEIENICSQYELKKGSNTDIKGGKYRQAIKKIGLSKKYDYETELIKLPHKERIEKVKIILNDIEKDEKLKSILDFNSVSGKITAFWGQFAFLDYANTSDYKLTDIIEKYFINSINKIALDKREEEIEDYCFMCSNPIYNDYVYESLGQKKKGSSNNEKELKTKPYSTSFINGLTQDLEGKSSQFWNHNPDVRICPLCAFIYACVPIGFIDAKNSFVFINKNDSINFLIEENKNYEYKLLKSKG
ncbi:Cas8a1 family CRISPR/Cas system-associated protein, partial [Brachyspira sp.]|uniref:Cas8a1 family CRISPR/Cas system-associated protein n=1 Tax=Brachyspira sp. TaxID=1977261 RepID=UPI003D7C6254